jgi:dTDP-4-dehydrorhamnose reductase
MRILLFGTSGQVGAELARALPALGVVLGLDRAAADFGDPDALRAAIRRERPDVVVNAAAYTAVDRAEAEPDEARRVNADAVGAMADEVRRLGAWLVHYSTDYVFDGGKAGAYVETDQPHPLNVYGATKLAGERLVEASGCRHLVFRTSWVHAARGRNFVRTILDLARDREELTVVDDQIGCPTSAALLARVTAVVLGRLAGPGLPPPSGVYHACAAGETSWHGYARFAVSQARRRGLALRAAPETILPIPSSERPTPARRPANSRLDTSRLTGTFGITLPSWQDDVTTTLEALVP